MQYQNTNISELKLRFESKNFYSIFGMGKLGKGGLQINFGLDN